MCLACGSCLRLSPFSWQNRNYCRNHIQISQKNAWECRVTADGIQANSYATRFTARRRRAATCLLAIGKAIHSVGIDKLGSAIFLRAGSQEKGVVAQVLITIQQPFWLSA